MSIEEWKKGDTITSDKMNRIVDALNTTEKAVHETNNRVDNIVENLAKVTTVSDAVKAKVADLIEKYDKKLTELQKSYDDVKVQLDKVMSNKQKSGKNTTK